MIITKKLGQLEFLTAENISASHCFTTRLGGVSAGIFDSMNIAIKEGETPENVERNLAILADALDFSLEDLVCTRQTPVQEHEFDEGKITKVATPEYPGELIRTCSRCGEEQVEKIPRLPEEEPPLKVFWESSGLVERFLILCTAGAALLGVISLFRKKR